MPAVSGAERWPVVEIDRTRGRSGRRIFAVATATIASVAGVTELFVDWREIVGGSGPTEAPVERVVSGEVSQKGGSGDVETLTGNVTQDNSRNIVLYNNAFRLEVVRAADAGSSTRQQVRDDVLQVLDSLLADVEGRSLSPEKAAALGQRLGKILNDAPISAYQLSAREFTLAPGTAYFLPGGENSFAYQGPTPDGTANAILVLRNGRQSTMRVGAVREFRQGAEDCRLLLHHVTPDFSAATFSFDCRS